MQNQKLTNKDIQQYKVHTANLHDPILQAVNEAQPFEQAANPGGEHRKSMMSSNEDYKFRDVFGEDIGQADVLNPTRSRNERPLDTIRGFEYAITGDLNYKEQLELRRIGWGFHEDFPFYNLQRNPEDNALPSMAPPPQFSSDQGIYQAGNYSAGLLKNDETSKKKKKKGLFGKKKKWDDLN